MTDIFDTQRHLSSSSSSSTITFVSPNDNDELHQRHTNHNNDTLITIPTFCPVALYRRNTEIQEVEEEEEEEEDDEEVGGGGGSFGFERERKKREREEGDQLSLLAILVTVFRKSLISCRSVGGVEDQLSSAAMEISWPTNVRHVAHVTFDRFNGFLGLPVEFEPEVPRRPPSASTRVFGVSTESMQLSFDSRGNSVPTILLMMQRRLYTRGGLQAEGIFRINAENGQEEYVREQLNRGIVPEDVDVHCLAGLIKAWFRELPTGLLDSLPPDQVMQAQTEEECSHLVRLLPPTEAALLDWAINLMADIAQFEHLNKMNARNIAMVFAPNMTQMADPLTALMYAVQVMNFLKTLIEKTMKDREDSILDVAAALNLEPSDENGHRGAAPQQSNTTPDENEGNNQDEDLRTLLPSSSTTDDDYDQDENDDLHSKIRDHTECILLLPPPDDKENIANYYCPPPPPPPIHNDNNNSNTGNNNTGWEEGEEEVEGGGGRRSIMVAAAGGRFQSKSRRTKTGQSSNNNANNNLKEVSSKKAIDMQIMNHHQMAGNGEKSKEISIISRLNSQAQRVEAWR